MRNGSGGRLEIKPREEECRGVKSGGGKMRLEGWRERRGQKSHLPLVRPTHMERAP